MSRRHVVVVAGSGRSGTSTAAGVLAHLGLRVPEPQVPADETDPRGFFEPQWVVDLQTRLLRRAGVMLTDARPSAAAAVDGFVDPALRRTRTGWDDVDCPAALRDQAEEAWQLLRGLATAGADGADGADGAAGTHEQLDRLRADYARAYDDAEALAQSSAEAAARTARRQARRAAGAAGKGKR